MEIQELNQFRSIEELVSYQGEVQGRLTAINLEHAGQPLPEELRGEFTQLKEQNEDLDKRIRELNARNAIIEQFAGDERTRERVDDTVFDKPVNRGSLKERDIYDLSTIRADVSRPEETRQVLRDRAMRAVEISTFPHVRDQDNARGHVQNLLDNYDTVAGDRGPGEIARRVLTTGSPAYRRGFMKYVAGKEVAWTTEERTAMAVGAGATGGYAIVYQLDPTFIPTSNLAVNPFRAIASVETIAGTNEWRGVTAGAMTASYAAEATEATDNSPTLAQPALVTQRVQSFAAVSIEISQDLPSLQANLARLIQDAKDVLEATQFTTGVGTTVFPQGVLVGATNQTTAGGVASFAVADLFTLETNLGPRFRPNAAFVANRAIYNKVRQFDTSGGSAMWIGYPNPLQGGLANNPPRGGGLEIRLIGYPAYEDSAMVTALTTANLIVVLGDWDYYKIIDRIGLDIEVIPQLLGTARGYPTGQRGIYAIWRNTAKVLDPAGFQVLKTG